MTFTSYAQNREDVLLYRAFGDIANGQYIDVGAADPEFNSVTKAFYDLGWSGVNVEPVAHLHDRLVAERPRDASLLLALGEDQEPTTLYSVVEFDEISTVVSELGHRYQREGRGVTESTVKRDTLESIWDTYITGEVHFLKVDVEGAELSVLRGANFARHRPWVILVEVVTFGVDQDTEGEANRILVDAGYLRTYFDGLNVFYVASERADVLVQAFATPVNVTDDYRIPQESLSALALARIAVELGMDATAGPREILERVIVLRSDRVRFENEVVAGRIDIETRTNAQSDLATRMEAMSLQSDSRQAELEHGRQQSFERERYIAALASEVHTTRRQLHERVAAGEAQFEAAVRQHRDILRSTSWRLTLPIRVLRRPGAYIRKFLKR